MSGAGTPVPLWHAGTALLCPEDRQGGRQPGWERRGARALRAQEEDPGGDGDSRLLGRDASWLTQLQRGVEAGGPTPYDLVSDQAGPSPHLLVQWLPDGTALSCRALGGETSLQQLPNEVLVSVPRMDWEQSNIQLQPVPEITSPNTQALRVQMGLCCSAS